MSSESPSAAAATDLSGAMDPLQQLLLAQLSGGSQDTGPSMPDIIEQALGDNPFAGQLAAAMRRRQQSEAQIVDEPVEYLDDAEEESPAADVLLRLYAEVEELRARNNLLADALGACGLCWGENPTCRRCRGRGLPGGRAPEPAAFESYVAPVIQYVEFDTAVPVTAATSPG